MTVMDFENILKNRLLPVLQESLNAHPHQKIIWLSQTASLDLFGHITPRAPVEIDLRKIDLYNKISRRAFK